MLDNRLAITTSSLGLHPSHSLPEKIEAAAPNGFSSLEIVYQEIVDCATSHDPPKSTHHTAQHIAQLCRSIQ